MKKTKQKNLLGKKGCCDGCSKCVLKFILWLWVIVFAIIPTALYLHPPLMRRAVFMNYFSGNFTNFPQYGRSTNNTRNFYAFNEASNLKLGVWHTLPDSDVVPGKNPTDAEFMEKLSNGKHIVFYMHGNSHHRAASFILQLYNVLNKMDNHVIALDYRGYGDSEGYPETERDLVEDALTVFKYIRQNAPNSRIYFWGHSLGTGVASSLIAELHKIELQNSVKGIVLEAPFTTLREAGQNHPHGFVFRFLPYFDSVFLDGFKKNGLFFENTNNLLVAPSPILIIHSEDDGIIPIAVGEKLYRELRSKGKDVTFKKFPGGHGYYHSRLSQAPDLQNVVYEFLESTEKFT